MTETDDGTTLDSSDAEALWDAWASADDEDILAQAAFERVLRDVAAIEDDGLYFRPGGWTVDLPATAARIACASAILAACFEVAGLHDLDREVIIAAAGLVASMDVRPVRLGRHDKRLAERLRQDNLVDVPVSAATALRSLPKRRRRSVDAEEIADALDRLTAAGVADREGEDAWRIRAKGSEAWIRIRLG